MVMRDTTRRTGKADHPREEDWVDYARGAGAPDVRARLARHLEDGCDACGQAVRLWEAVSGAARDEPSYEPPAEAVREVLGRFRIQGRPSLAERVVRQAALLFDSFREPLPAGVRATGTVPRQLLYRAGPYTVKLRVEPEPESERLSIVGQILDEADPSAVLQDIGVLALQGSTMLDRTLTNRLGEFTLEPDAAANLYLSVAVPRTGPYALKLGTDGRGAKGKGRSR